MKKTGSLQFIFFLIHFYLSVAGANSQNRATAIVDQNPVALGGTFTLTVEVSQSGASDVQSPRLPELKNFEVINSWESSSSSHRMIQTPQGMKIESENKKLFHFMLSPQKQGQFSIDSVEVVIAGQVYRTQPIVMQILPAGATPPQRVRPQRPALPDPMDPFAEEDDLFNQLLQQRQKVLEDMLSPPPTESQALRSLPNAQLKTIPKNPNEAFFIQVEVDKLEVYEGEQITVNWSVLTRGQMETLDRLKFPDLKGFWKEIIEEVPSIQFTQEVINGVVYRKALLASHALFPIKSGDAFIDEYKIRSKVRLPVNGFGGGFFGRSYEYTKSSQKVKIKVKPIPTENRPASFTGAVGQFNLSAQLPSQQVMQHQPFTIKIRVEGSGNAKLIELPKIDWPAGLEFYDVKSQSQFFKDGKSYKEFEVLLTPRQSGVVEIPSLQFSFFDPETGKFYDKNTEILTLEVLPGKSGTSDGSNNPSLKAPHSQQQTSGFIYQWSQPWAILHQNWFWGVLYLAVGLFLLGYAFKLGYFKKSEQSLSKIVALKMQPIENASVSGNYRQLGTLLINLYYFVLSQSENWQEHSDQSSINVENLLENINPALKAEVSTSLKLEFEILQALAFAPESSLEKYKNQEVLVQLLSSNKKIISKLVADLEKTKKGNSYA